MGQELLLWVANVCEKVEWQTKESGFYGPQTGNRYAGY